ncbi:MAG: FtsW/RodA/SpoVE family cell cycle protein, partial [Oscillospiraceae bacterium]|nr:FtsW/RodA/SpoVE family cell cycle protein [Oscillospiraceae bacterium]
MQGVIRAVREFVKKADMILLILCITATVFGVIIISSATNYLGNSRYVLVQLVALALGIILYVVLTLVDVDIIAERRELLLIFCLLFIATLRFFGVVRGGNRSWLDFSWLPFNIQPGEICKIFFIIIIAKIMSVKQNKLSSPWTVAQLAGITLLFAGAIMYFSWDDGIAL